jgi:hypothetical protein
VALLELLGVFAGFFHIEHDANLLHKIWQLLRRICRFGALLRSSYGRALNPAKAGATDPCPTDADQIATDRPVTEGAPQREEGC